MASDRSTPPTGDQPPVEDVYEVITSEQALYLAIFSMIATVIFLYFYRNHQLKESKKESLNIQYQFKFPPEKTKYEKMLLEEPEEQDKKEQWTKEIKTVLLRRAIMSLSLSQKITQDYRSYYMIYKSGINLDIWESVKRAKEMVDKELKVIQQEADWLAPGWGKMIFMQANQLRQHMMKKQMEEAAKKKQALEKEEQKKKEQERSDRVYRELMSMFLFLTKFDFKITHSFFLKFQNISHIF